MPEVATEQHRPLAELGHPVAVPQAFSIAQPRLLLGDPEKNLLVVMRNGQLYKQASAVTAARA